MSEPDLPATGNASPEKGSLKAWMVSDDECMILCRAQTRGKARMFWPAAPFDFREDFLALRVTRQPWLDGDGPAREIDDVWRRCEGPFDLDGDCIAGHFNCVEGEYIDREATVAKANGEAKA